MLDIKEIVISLEVEIFVAILEIQMIFDGTFLLDFQDRIFEI